MPVFPSWMTAAASADRAQWMALAGRAIPADQSTEVRGSAGLRITHRSEHPSSRGAWPLHAIPAAIADIRRRRLPTPIPVGWHPRLDGMGGTSRWCWRRWPGPRAVASWFHRGREEAKEELRRFGLSAEAIQRYRTSGDGPRSLGWLTFPMGGAASRCAAVLAFRVRDGQVSCPAGSWTAGRPVRGTATRWTTRRVTGVRELPMRRGGRSGGGRAPAGRPRREAGASLMTHRSAGSASRS